MPGVNHVQPEPRYSASNWYTNVDASLMGVQSTEQFINKYHHVIGKTFTMTKFMFHKKEHEEAGNRGSLPEKLISNYRPREKNAALFNKIYI